MFRRWRYWRRRALQAEAVARAFQHVAHGQETRAKYAARRYQEKADELDRTRRFMAVLQGEQIDVED